MKTNKNVVIKQSIIPELVSGSSTKAVTQQQALKTLKKFQRLSYFTTAHGFTARSVTPTLRAATYAGYSGHHGFTPRRHPELDSGSCRFAKAFTLIELLVVVLIIGILAAVALPQYQKAVEKSRAAQALALLKSMYQSAAFYYMENGTYPNDFSDMDLDMSWTGNTRWCAHSGIKTKSNDDWSLQLYTTDAGELALYLGRISGKYAGAGFITRLVNRTGTVAPLNIQCAERISAGVTFSTDLNAGDYCIKIMGGTPRTDSMAGTYRNYQLP